MGGRSMAHTGFSTEILGILMVYEPSPPKGESRIDTAKPSIYAAFLYFLNLPKRTKKY